MSDDKGVLLCVDDEVIILLALKQELKLHLRQQIQVDTCDRAEEALQRIGTYRNRDVKVILVISDWLMPGMRGDVFLGKVHADYPDIPIILVTGQADEGEITRLRETIGLRHVLRKPWSSKELLSIVDRILADLA